jgi:hypothetical protein
LPASAFQRVEHCKRQPSEETTSQRDTWWTWLGKELAQLVLLTFIIYGIPLLVGGLLILIGHWF